MDSSQKHEKIKLVEINSYLTCYLCKGYLIDATTISECLHSFCRSCIIKFLQENCYCPVCEVIINKAKPCLKLDKTLQDIVYKLVPGLFVREMQRRKVFYQSKPGLAPKVSPEERGEDTERTIFNPQDAISLSLEYISDDSAPGAIPSLQKESNVAEESQDNPMKRYLQCPGMCRIEVLKKFVRNKYNVDTNLFHIDILYKRVPLPDHYTLIDIGYIYSWKRNEPMKFFFRITDINKVAERFDYFDGKVAPEVVAKPARVKHNGEKASRTEKKRESTSQKKDKVEVKQKEVAVKFEKDEVTGVNVKMEAEVSVKSPDVKSVKSGEVTSESCDKVEKKEVSCVKVDKDEVILKPEITEEIKSKIQNGNGAIKNSVYTNITLNRDDNVEIITKIQKVSNKEGHPIGLNIINHTVKKTNKVQNVADSSESKVVPSGSSVEKKSEIKTEEEKREELEKSKFLKSIELTAKSSLEKKEVKEVKEVKSVTPASSSSSQKRKNSSPMKNDKVQEKRARIEKKPVKIIIQPKSISNPAVRQMVTNVNQNANNMSKIVEQTTAKTTDLQSLIDNCKINIPSSLSITLNEGGEGAARTPPSIPPVKNFIEILKIPDNGETKKDKVSPTKENRNTPTFQKIFEESIIKKAPDAAAPKPAPLDLTSPPDAPTTPKRKILEIASQLHKKTKIEQEKKKEGASKIAIPRLVTQRTLKPQAKHERPQSTPKPQAKHDHPQTSATLHSSSLGLNYTVSVGQAGVNGEAKRQSPSTSKAKTKTAKNLTPNQLLEKYNIQNLAQLTASFNLNGGNYGAAYQHAMFYKQLEQQNWLSHTPLLQYEKYLQSLNAQNKLMGNIKEN